MADTDRGAAGDASPPRAEVDESLVSRRALRDLAVVLALPAMWVDLEPDDIAAGLLDALFGMFRLSSGYVRFGDPAGGPSLEHWRPGGPGVPPELEMALAATPTREQGTVRTVVAPSTSSERARVTCISPAFPGEDGMVIIASAEPDFPTEFELHLLRAIAGQATISIHAARRLSVERAARATAEAALQRANVFLARIAEDLAAPLALLEKRAAQAHELSAERLRPNATSHQGSDTAAGPTGPDLAGDNGQALAPSARLTRRETEVLGLLAQGLSNKEIAAVLWLSDRTIERHITGLYRKIGVERRTEATAFALRYGLIDANTPEG
jgi:DNA-binding NarL/FixJ family response regulator